MTKESSSPLAYTLSQYASSADSHPLRSLCVLPSERNSQTNFQVLAGGQNGLLSVFEFDSTSNECLGMVPKDGSRPHTASAILSSPIEIFSYATGSRDGNIRIYSVDHTLTKTLTGHEKPVTSLSWLSINNYHQYLLSGSWDGTAKIWDVENGICVATLPDHENTVTVLGLSYAGKVGSTGKVVTASAGIAEAGKIVNHKIRIWSVETSENSLKCTLLQTPTDNHSGPIRGLSCDKDSPHLFFSCSNDGQVKVRDAGSGECILTLSTQEGGGEPPILLDVQVSSSGLIAAAVEDGNLAIWSQETGDIQRIPHPGCVWKVIFLANGDICTACQDGYLRIFTVDQSRYAKPDEIQKFEESALASIKKSSTGPSAEEIAKLPKWEMRSIHTGRSEGQVQVFAKDGKAIAAQWNDASKTWIEVGEVMGSNENAGSIDGVKYDHVLPIEVDIPGGGIQNLKIGYNNGENPFGTAQNFIDTHMLDQNYLSQIADYIRQRVGDSGVTLGNGSSSSGRTASTPAALSNPPKQQKLYQNVPMKGYLIFDVPDMSKALPKIFKKLTDINSEQGAMIDLAPLDNLNRTLSATSRYHSSKIGISEINVLGACLQKWNIESVFPVLDLLRITVLHPDAGSMGKEGFWSDLMNIILQKLSLVTNENASSNKLIAAVPMLCLRISANSFRGGKCASNAVISNLSMVLSFADKFSTFAPSNKNLRLTVATLLLNVSSYQNSTISSEATTQQKECLRQILNIALKILQSNVYESEALNRILLAVGTVLFQDGGKEIGRELNILNEVLKLTNLQGKGTVLVEEITSLMQ